MRATNCAHLSFCPRPIVSRHLGRLGQPKNVADAGPSPESEPDGSCAPSFVYIEVNLSNEPTSARASASQVRFPSPTRAIEIAIERARPIARATAVRFKSLKFIILQKVQSSCDSSVNLQFGFSRSVAVVTVMHSTHSQMNLPSVKTLGMRLDSGATAYSRQLKGKNCYK